MTHPPLPGGRPFDDGGRDLVRERVLAECARLGGGDVIDLGGRELPVALLADELLAPGAVNADVTSRARLAAAWCRVHGAASLATILQTLAEVRELQHHGEPVEDAVGRLLRSVSARAATHVGPDITEGIHEILAGSSQRQVTG